MRLWHKDLIEYLPRQQLLGQWRECCCIAKNIAETGTPNHLLVNKIMNYPLSHFYNYTIKIIFEMERRGFNINRECFEKYVDKSKLCMLPTSELFPNWHNKRYLWQCYRNLQEKYDCGGITYDEWKEILKGIFEFR